MKIQKILIALFVLIGITGFTTKISAEENVESTEVQVVESQTLEESAPVMEHAPSEKVEKAATLAPSAVEVDKTKLRAEYDKALLIDQSLYLSSSNETLNSTLVMVKSELNRVDIIQEDVDTLTQTLISVMKSLEKKGNSSELQSLYEKAEKIDSKKLTLESEDKLKDAMLVAKGLLDSGEAAQNDLDAAFNSLTNVLNNLDYLTEAAPVDKKLLEKEIKKAEVIVVTDKEDVSRTRFLLALDQSRKALLDESKSQDDIDALVFKLQNAQKNLVTLEGFVDRPVIDDEKLSYEDVIGKSVVSVTPDVVDKEVLPSTGMGNLGFLLSNSMIFSGFALILKERKK